MTLKHIKHYTFQVFSKNTTHKLVFNFQLLTHK